MVRPSSAYRMAMRETEPTVIPRNLTGDPCTSPSNEVSKSITNVYRFSNQPAP